MIIMLIRYFTSLFNTKYFRCLLGPNGIVIFGDQSDGVVEVVVPHNEKVSRDQNTVIHA